MVVKNRAEKVEAISLSEVEQETRQKPTIFSRILKKTSEASKKLDSLGVEIRGIQRIPPYERGTSKQFFSVAGLWLSAAGGLSSMSSYFLGPLIFELTFRQSLMSGLISMAIGCGVAAYCSTMGPQSGCRQMVTARYLFGWYFVKFVALVSIIGVMGWSIVNCVVGGEMLAAISDNKIPIWVGIIIVTALSFLVAIFGIKQVLRVETFLSVPVLTCFLLLYIASSDKFNLLDTFKNDDIEPSTIKGNWMSFFSLCYSITSTWGSITSDYYILFPEDTASYKVFLLTFFGTLLPTTFVGVLGLILASCAATYEPWNEEYQNYGMGGLLHAGFERWNGFGKFCVVVLILSLISNNIINTYSAAFSIQLSSVHMARVPRWVWAIACTIFYLVCALVGRNHFSEILGNFLPMVGYWISIYFIILLEENVIFRAHFLRLYSKEFPSHQTVEGGASSQLSLREFKTHKSRFTKHHYNWDMWNNQDVLTHGYAATLAFLFGVAGVVLGMAQVYWIGPIARHYGANGGDLGMWLSMAFSGVAYPGLRYIELRKYGR
ncbi:LANO_0F08548g1_1 [Lachancea nothofagi CBS 11611]|uniref:Vitamin B6 transporter TPN1 n=1 Tax=Lachancea nothofagi CBS 11611 TaxID=1266666 RepID=A0A1G4K9H6_9SACH|nr:LANO_0F08548g1_1 [Lachancea nothofagi CBS 11611]